MANKSTKRNKSAPQFQTQNGQRVVILTQEEYERLKQKADEWEPLLPEPDENGNYPAVEYARASLARKIIRHRRRLGLTQDELARRAGIRPQTLNRIERGTHSTSAATVAKIDKALSQTQVKNGTASGK